MAIVTKKRRPISRKDRTDQEWIAALMRGEITEQQLIDHDPWLDLMMTDDLYPDGEYARQLWQEIGPELLAKYGDDLPEGTAIFRNAFGDPRDD